jgi:hypothetical protein
MKPSSAVPHPLRRWRAALNRDALRGAWMRARRPLAWGVGLWLGLQAVLALGVPWLVKGPVLSAAAEALARPVSVQSVRFNPFTLALTVDGLRIQDRAPSSQADLVAVQRILVNLSMGSLLRFAPVLDALHVESPHLTLVRTGPGRFNISDLLDKWAAQPAPDDTDTAPARFALHDLQVHGGELHFDDPTQRTHHAVQKIEFTVPYVASFKGDQDTAVTPLLTASVHGGALRLETQAKPFKSTRETTLHLSLKGMDLASALKGLPALAPWQIEQGTLDTQWQLTVRAAEPAQAAPPQVRPAAASQAADPASQATSSTPPASAPAAAEPRGLTVLAKAQLQLNQLVMGNPQGDSLRWDTWRLGSDQLSVHLRPEQLQWQVGEAQLSLQNLQLRDAKDRPPMLALASLQLDHLAVDSARQAVTLGLLAWDGLQVQAHRAADGTLNLLSLVDRLPHASVEPTPTATPSPAPSAAPPWSLDVAQVRIQNTGAHWHDQAAKPEVQLGVKGLQGTLEAVSSRADASLRYDLRTELEHGGAVALKGSAEPGSRQAAADLELTNLNLAVVQPYLAQVLNLQLSKGNLDTRGRISVAMPGAPDTLRVKFQGESAINDLYTREPDTQDEFLRWKRLGATGLDIDVAPLALSAKDHVRIGSIALQDLFAKVVISPAGRINLQDILRLPPNNPKAAPTAAAAETPSAPAAKTDSPQVHLGGVKIAGGRLNFTDLFVKPNYNTTITNLSGTVSAVGPQSPPAQVALQGRVEGDAPLTIQGRLNPVSAALFIDIQAKARGIDLPMLSPYSTKYAGYPIQRGKLSLDVSYKIENGQLQAENSVFLDQLTFGERVDSPTATQLPVLFAVSLLKNSRGEINLHLPVAGSLNDPQFSVSAVVSQVFVNLIKRAVTAPFSLLASMFGGGGSEGDLSTADFVPGTAELKPESLPRLTKLSQALVERPALKLDITAQLDPVAELGDIRRVRLMERVQAERRKAGAQATANANAAGDAARPGAPAPIDERDYAQWLQRVYDNTTIPNKPRNLVGVSKKIPVADMESLVLSAIAVSEDDMRTLAHERIQAVRKVLAEQVPGERLYTLAPVIAVGKKKEPGAPADEGTCSAACVIFSLHS